MLQRHPVDDLPASTHASFQPLQSQQVLQLEAWWQPTLSKGSLSDTHNTHRLVTDCRKNAPVSNQQ